MPWKKGQSGNPQKKFKPGVSGNPSGRPRKLKLTDAYRSWLEEIDPESGMSNAERIAIGQGKKALDGDTIAAREMADRTEGKSRQPIELVAKVEVKAVLIDRAARPPKPKKNA